jgi:hypothetical protein
MMAARDITVAVLWSRERREMRRGTITIPPPTPKKPEKRPAISPMAANDHQAGSVFARGTRQA